MDMKSEAKHSGQQPQPTVQPDGKFTKTLLPSDFEPTPCSVICGRGKKVSLSPGNLHLSCLIGSHLSQYSKAVTKQEKSSILQNIVTYVKQLAPAGGFVKFEQGSWWEVDDHAAREKVSGLFRDKLHSQYESSSKSKVAKRRARKTAAASANANPSQTAATAAGAPQDDEKYAHARDLLDLAMSGGGSTTSKKEQSVPKAVPSTSSDVGTFPPSDVSAILRQGIHPLGGYLPHAGMSNLTQLMLAGIGTPSLVHHPHLALGSWPMASLNHQVQVAAAAAALNQTSHAALIRASIEQLRMQQDPLLLQQQRRMEVESLLDRFDLSQYKEKFLESGYDSIGWLHEHATDGEAMNVLSKTVGFKPGHAIRFRHNLTKEVEAALGKPLRSAKPTEGSQEGSSDDESEEDNSTNAKKESSAPRSGAPTPPPVGETKTAEATKPVPEDNSPGQKVRPLRIWSPM